jgi:hypothetical protein
VAEVLAPIGPGRRTPAPSVAKRTVNEAKIRKSRVSLFVAILKSARAGQRGMVGECAVGSESLSIVVAPRIATPGSGTGGIVQAPRDLRITYVKRPFATTSSRPRRRTSASAKATALPTRRALASH